MRKILLFVTLLSFCVNSFAQTPTYIRSASGANNSFPFNTTSSNMVQNLFYASDFVPTLPMGTITKIYYKSATTTTSTFSNVTIKIGTTTLTGFTAGPWNTGLTTVFGPATYSNSFVSGQWFEFVLSTPFFYDGTSNFIVEASQTSYTSGVIIQQGSVGGNRRKWGNVTSTTSSAGTGSPYFGIDIIPGSPCTKAIGAPATNINSTSATINWNSVPGSFKYEYIIDTTNPGQAYTTITSTTATSAFVTGLIPNKLHFMRVRNYCSAISYSMWDTVAFTTLPPCEKIPKINIGYVDSNSAVFQWDTASNVVSWRYLVDTIRANPSNGNPLIENTTNRFRSLTGLKEGTWYYVHVKTKCVQNDSSAWALDSFYTPTPCRKPVLQLAYLSSNNAVIYWDPVKTVVNYEYFFGSVWDLPGNGTPLYVPSLQTPFLQPKTNYSVHVRCNCNDNNIKTSSGWASLDFTSEPPLSVHNTPAQKLSLETYPNPVKQKLTLDLKGLMKGKASVSITDLKGAVIRNVPLESNITTIDVSALASGVYILQYTDSDSNFTTKFTKE